MNPFDPDIFAAENPCVCCGGGGECACALLIPLPPNPPLTDYATAESIVSDPLLVADCIAFFEGLTTNVSSFSASFSGTSLLASMSLFSPSGSLAGPIVFNVSGNVGDVFSVASTGGTSINAWLYDCAGTELENIMGSTPQSFSALPASGNYYIRVLISTPFSIPPAFFSTGTITITSSGTFLPNPVIALYDDSGTTRQLEACPKMLLPPLTESTGEWYMDCATADAVLADPLQVASCIAYKMDDGTPFTGFSASGGGPLVLSVTGFGPGGANTGSMWASINVGAAGDIITAATDGTDSFLAIYDYSGNIVSPLRNSGASTDSDPLPYPGRYIVFMDCAGTPGTTSLTDTLSSSGTMSVNPIQALYATDPLLDCSGRLNCGDSCP